MFKIIFWTFLKSYITNRQQLRILCFEETWQMSYSLSKKHVKTWKNDKKQYVKTYIWQHYLSWTWVSVNHLQTCKTHFKHLLWCLPISMCTHYKKKKKKKWVFFFFLAWDFRFFDTKSAKICFWRASRLIQRTGPDFADLVSKNRKSQAKKKKKSHFFFFFFFLLKVFGKSF